MTTTKRALEIAQKTVAWRRANCDNAEADLAEAARRYNLAVTTMAQATEAHEAALADLERARAGAPSLSVVA